MARRSTGQITAVDRSGVGCGVKVVTLDLPPPLSTNRRRKIDWASEPDHARWIKNADAHVLIAKSQGLKLERIKRFEIEIVVDESVNVDLDNNCKSLIDFLRRINLIYDDNPKCMRKFTMTWGAAPAGIKIIVTPLAGEVSSSGILSTLRGKIRPMNIPKLESGK
jgi:hypothetical protein